jgi:hypothetical protein
MYSITVSATALFLLLSGANAQSSTLDNAALCDNMVSSFVSCSAASAAFYATVTDQAQALATAAACICYSSGVFNGPAVDAGLSACVSQIGISGSETIPSLGVTIEGIDMAAYEGFCNSYTPTVRSSCWSLAFKADTEQFRPPPIKKPGKLLAGQRRQPQWSGHLPVMIETMLICTGAAKSKRTVTGLSVR